MNCIRFYVMQLLVISPGINSVNISLEVNHLTQSISFLF